MSQKYENPVIEKLEAAVATLLQLIECGTPLQIAFSGGKDSSCCAILFLEAVRRAQACGLTQPRHTISSATTGTENPAMESHLIDAHEEMDRFIRERDLPVDIRMVEPALAASFVVSTIGRGTLPRFPENARARSCAIMWKVKPQQKLSSEIANTAKIAGHREPVCIIGTRRLESKARSVSMAERNESDTAPVRNQDGKLVLSLIREWNLDDVWSLLELFMAPEDRPFETFTDGTLLFRLFDLYRDANEGVCGVVLGESGTRKSCGSRFGCWNCTVTGQRDRSMESMLHDEKYSYMRGLNDFRNLLVATQFDMARRELIGRTISKAGYLPVRPDVYSYLFRRQMLAYLITLDVLEAERAEQLEADLFTGRVPDTVEN